MSLTPQQAAKAEQAFRQSDEGSKGYLHSKEFFYACQALGFNYTFVEVFEMYKRYDDDHNLGMDLDEFKAFYAEKLRDPNSHVDPTKVSNVYRSDGVNTGTAIPHSHLQPGVYKQSSTTISQTHGQPVIHTTGGTTGYTTTTYQGQPVTTKQQGQTTTTYTTAGGQTVTTTTTEGVTSTQQPQVVYQTGGVQQQQVVYQTGGVRTTGGTTYVSNVPGTHVTSTIPKESELIQQEDMLLEQEELSTKVELFTVNRVE